MSKRIEVPEKIKAIVKFALPTVDVRGMDTEEAKPERVGPLGMVIVRSGDPGDPEVDLCPPTYWWEHRIPIELAAYQTASGNARAALDDMARSIWALIEADRTLGGLVLWTEAEAPTDGEVDQTGAKAIGWADFAIIATYSTASPLG
ncbi:MULTISPECIES: hypothetical protein [unclassified Sphingomonas]|uniref:hypothetical protein n=1 Tax=unclassified Sphingomonas TaxID=196159 RepID=UPI0022698C64|nr:MULTISPECIES: hypothetical protein [unclassified Sphingomonas]